MRKKNRNIKTQNKKPIISNKPYIPPPANNKTQSNNHSTSPSLLSQVASGMAVGTTMSIANQAVTSVSNSLFGNKPNEKQDSISINNQCKLITDEFIQCIKLNNDCELFHEKIKIFC